jgi:hypothetical protein|tara:strand:+ start:9797 stop:10477 length:681 start_codon:yes stop_codon:yes gene_type:complete
MSKSKKEATPTINDINWTDHVLELLSDDEKIKGNPTTDGLRRVFEIALDCTITESTSHICQSPEPENGNRATVIHSLRYVLNNKSLDDSIKTRTVDGSADVYWGNCDKIFRNHPVAVAETRAEGRALRRALRLRKVVAAEELAEEVEDLDGNTVNKITNNQINFIDVMSKRLNINVSKLLSQEKLDSNIYTVSHTDAVGIIRILSKYQQDMSAISEDITGYNNEWK